MANHAKNLDDHHMKTQYQYIQFVMLSWDVTSLPGSHMPLTKPVLYCTTLYNTVSVLVQPPQNGSNLVSHWQSAAFEFKPFPPRWSKTQTTCAFHTSFAAWFLYNENRHVWILHVFNMITVWHLPPLAVLSVFLFALKSYLCLPVTFRQLLQNNIV